MNRQKKRLISLNGFGPKGKVKGRVAKKKMKKKNPARTGGPR